MTQHYNDLDDATKVQTANLLDNMDVPESRAQNSEFGLCARCKFFAITRTEFQVVRACCVHQQNYPIALTSAHPVTQCSLFKDDDIPELWEMRQMAHYIEIPPRKAGFITDDGMADR